MFPFSLPDVPQYCQYYANYCGSASAQMIMNGYPDPAARQLIPQTAIYSWIQISQAEAQPFKAPGMVRDAIHQFNSPPSPAHFVANAFSDAYEAMYSILLWMRRTKYPAATMIAGNHWVVITGYKTDMDPEGNANVDLQEIEFHNPLPLCSEPF